MGHRRDGIQRHVDSSWRELVVTETNVCTHTRRVKISRDVVSKRNLNLRNSQKPARGKLVRAGAREHVEKGSGCARAHAKGMRRKNADLHTRRIVAEPTKAKNAETGSSENASTARSVSTSITTRAGILSTSATSHSTSSSRVTLSPRPPLLTTARTPSTTMKWTPWQVLSCNGTDAQEHRHPKEDTRSRSMWRRGTTPRIRSSRRSTHAGTTLNDGMDDKYGAMSSLWTPAPMPSYPIPSTTSL